MRLSTHEFCFIFIFLFYIFSLNFKSSVQFDPHILETDQDFSSIYLSNAIYRVSVASKDTNFVRKIEAMKS